MNTILSIFFKKYDDFCWTSDCGYLAIIEYQDGVKNFAYITAQDCGEGLEIGVQHAQTRTFNLDYLENFEILKIADLNALNCHLQNKSFSSQIADLTVWKDVQSTLDIDEKAKDIGWSLVHLVSPDVEMGMGDDGSYVGRLTGDTFDKFVVANVGYGTMDDGEMQGVELDTLTDSKIDLRKLTLEDQLIQYHGACAYKYIKLDLEAILNANTSV